MHRVWRLTLALTLCDTPASSLHPHPPPQSCHQLSVDKHWLCLHICKQFIYLLCLAFRVVLRSFWAMVAAESYPFLQTFTRQSSQQQNIVAMEVQPVAIQIKFTGL